MKNEALVTKDTIRDLLQTKNPAQVIGWALVVIFKNQTLSEQVDNATTEYNGIGFTGFDAKSGSLTAKYFMEYGYLMQWQIDAWMRIEKSGYPRICKYYKQLNEEAIKKQHENKNQIHHH